MSRMNCKARTVALNGIVGDTAQHSELGVLVQTEALTHPGEEMR